MRIVVDYNMEEVQNIRIDSALYLGDYAVRLQFNDGTDRLVDFKPFLTKSVHPSIKKYLDEKHFSNFLIVDGNLNWNDYDLIFPIWDLYQGKID
ncbi:MAG TPA: DUF2442 domain-containing protein [Prolixibacteraceae bacterium]|jgi:hypothetical protein|nr:DUF2442 domain-containing protein [Prolixibacteraceae bacterium]